MRKYYAYPYQKNMLISCVYEKKLLILQPNYKLGRCG